jgi:hypothetical protein
VEHLWRERKGIGCVSFAEGCFLKRATVRPWVSCFHQTADLQDGHAGRHIIVRESVTSRRRSTCFFGSLLVEASQGKTRQGLPSGARGISTLDPRLLRSPSRTLLVSVRSRKRSSHSGTGHVNTAKRGHDQGTPRWQSGLRRLWHGSHGSAGLPRSKPQVQLPSKSDERTHYFPHMEPPLGSTR